MRREAGFTLIEVLVALTIGSLVVVMVRQSFADATDLAARLAGEARPHATRMEARAFLTPAFGSLEIGTSQSHGFEGLPDRVTFWAALGSGAPTGLTLVARDGLLMAQERSGATRALDSAAALGCDYLLAYGSDARWVQEWHSPASAPLAARLRLRRADGSADTLLFLIGPRG